MTCGVEARPLEGVNNRKKKSEETCSYSLG